MSKDVEHDDSREDAKQADNGKPSFEDLVGLFKDNPIDLTSGWCNCKEEGLEAVQQRSGDGPAWLDEYETYLESNRQNNIDFPARKNSMYFRGYSVGIELCLELFRELRWQAQSKNNTGESQEG